MLKKKPGGDLYFGFGGLAVDYQRPGTYSSCLSSYLH